MLSGDCVELGEDELPYAPLLTALRPARRATATPPSTRSGAPAPRRTSTRSSPALGGGAAARATAPSRACSRRCWRCSTRCAEEAAGAARDRGPALGRQLHPLVHRLPGAHDVQRAPAGASAPTAPTSSTAATRCGRCWPSSRSDPYTRLIELPRFTREELGEQLEGILADRPDPELVERRLRAQRGQRRCTPRRSWPLGLDGRGALPPTLRDALMLRVERLSTRAQERAAAGWPASRLADHAARGGRGRARARPSCATRCARPWRATSS